MLYLMTENCCLQNGHVSKLYEFVLAIYTTRYCLWSQKHMAHQQTLLHESSNCILHEYTSHERYTPLTVTLTTLDSPDEELLQQRKPFTCHCKSSAYSCNYVPKLKHLIHFKCPTEFLNCE